MPPIGPESSDSRAEQEGNRSRTPRRRLQAVQLPLSPRRPSVRLSTRSMSGLRVYSTSVTGSREVSGCLGPALGESAGCPDPPRGRGGGGGAWGTASLVRSQGGPRGSILNAFNGLPGASAALA